MFALVQNNQFVRFIPEGTAFEIDGVQYPQNWLNLSTPEEKAALGVVDVIYGAYPSDQYYWVSQDAPVYKGGIVHVDYIATPKDLDGLKAQICTSLNAMCYATLLPTDFMDFRPNYTPPAGWLEWRQSVRDACDDAKVAVKACVSVEELIAIPAVDWPKDPDYVPPVDTPEVLP